MNQTTIFDKWWEKIDWSKQCYFCGASVHRGKRSNFRTLGLCSKHEAMKWEDIELRKKGIMQDRLNDIRRERGEVINAI